MAWALYNLTTFAVHRRDVEAAEAPFAECLVLRSGQGNPGQIVKTIAAVARCRDAGRCRAGGATKASDACAFGRSLTLAEAANLARETLSAIQAV